MKKRQHHAFIIANTYKGGYVAMHPQTTQYMVFHDEQQAEAYVAKCLPMENFELVVLPILLTVEPREVQANQL